VGGRGGGGVLKCTIKVYKRVNILSCPFMKNKISRTGYIFGICVCENVCVQSVSINSNFYLWSNCVKTNLVLRQSVYYKFLLHYNAGLFQLS
jgi:hypothetical protein